jgi:cytochrome P450 family 9
MKMMFGMVSECAQDFINHFESKLQNGKIVVNAREVFARYTIDGISTAALGFKGDCIENEESSLLKIAKSTVEFKLTSNLKMILARISKKLYIMLGLQFFPKEIYPFFEKVIIDAMKEREARNIFRPDVIQLLIQLKKGQLESQAKEDEKDLANFSANIEYNVGSKNQKQINWVKEDFMAQGAIFFIAGFDTTKNLLQMTSYELAKNKNVQQELIEEVDEVLATLNGKPVTYEALHKMKFLDAVISESLRLWPPSPFTNRSCNKDYNLDLGNGEIVKIKSGEDIYIPIMSIHRDPKYFSDPLTFDPHRFGDDKKDSIIAGSYIPFGYGPRVCIGSRFALMEAKLLIFNILSKFTIEVCDKTPKKLEYVASSSFDFKEKIFVELCARNL